MGENNLVVAAMSGGIDSTVTAALLQKEGYEVIGVTLRLVECSDIKGNCCGIEGESKARYACKILNIPHYVVNCVKEFEEFVLKTTWETYSQAKTPNPCLICNEKIKFGFLVQWAKQMKAVKVATGHYAQLMQDEEGLYHLSRGIDKNKDQSYFLARLTQTELSTALFPLGTHHKSEIKEMGKEYNLVKSELKESQDACFVQEGKQYAEILREKIQAEPLTGKIITTQGKILGMHFGIHHFTVGQRKGLGLSYPRRLFVKSLSDTGEVFVTEDENELLTSTFTISEFRFIGKVVEGEFDCDIQMRYRQKAVSCRVSVSENGECEVTLAEPSLAVTPGQAAVLYRDNEVIGSGWVT